MAEGPRFAGYCPVKVDPKGRLVIPVKFRPQLGGKVIFQAANVNCLYIYPAATWEAAYAALAQRAEESEMDMQRLEQFMRFSESDNDVDGGGRVLVPQNLREDMGLTGDLILAGSNNKLELWQKNDFKAYTGQLRGHLAPAVSKP